MKVFTILICLVVFFACKLRVGESNIKAQDNDDVEIKLNCENDTINRVVIVELEEGKITVNKGSELIIKGPIIETRDYFEIVSLSSKYVLSKSFESLAIYGFTYRPVKSRGEPGDPKMILWNRINYKCSII